MHVTEENTRKQTAFHNQPLRSLPEEDMVLDRSRMQNPAQTALNLQRGQLDVQKFSGINSGGSAFDSKAVFRNPMNP